MNKIVSVAEIQTIEREADAKGLSYTQMMENAGNGLAIQINSAYQHNDEQSVLALIGSGNNGGDALVALAILAELGWRTSAYLVRPRQVDDPLLKRVKDRSCALYTIDSDPNFQTLLDLLETHEVLVDGVLGTGIRLPLSKDIAACLGFVRQYVVNHKQSLHVVAVDCPSGVDCDRGEAAKETIPAEMTVTMAAVKHGLINFPAANLTGKLVVVNIGDMSNLASWKNVTTWMVDSEFARKALPPRPRNSHKGSFGTALIVAGSLNYTGAAFLAGTAAYRAGAGLVQMAVPSPLHGVLAGDIPEAIWLLLPHENGFISAESTTVIMNNLDKSTALLLGPGLGLHEGTQEFIKRLLDYRDSEVAIPPFIIDADGLKLLTGLSDWYLRLPPLTVLTPHPGEMSILSGLPTDQIQANRIRTAQRYASSWGHIVVLKGAFTVIASPDGETAVIPVATPALARAGTGDVLAGVIVGLLAQGILPYEAAVAGAWIHAIAGLRAEESIGATSVVASDLLNKLVDVFTELSIN